MESWVRKLFAKTDDFGSLTTSKVRQIYESQNGVTLSLDGKKALKRIIKEMLPLFLSPKSDQAAYEDNIAEEALADGGWEAVEKEGRAGNETGQEGRAENRSGVEEKTDSDRGTENNNSDEGIKAMSEEDKAMSEEDKAMSEEDKAMSEEDKGGSPQERVGSEKGKDSDDNGSKTDEDRSGVDVDDQNIGKDKFVRKTMKKVDLSENSGSESDEPQPVKTTNRSTLKVTKKPAKHGEDDDESEAESDMSAVSGWKAKAKKQETTTTYSSRKPGKGVVSVKTAFKNLIKPCYVSVFDIRSDSGSGTSAELVKTRGGQRMSLNEWSSQKKRKRNISRSSKSGSESDKSVSQEKNRRKVRKTNTSRKRSGTSSSVKITGLSTGRRKSKVTSDEESGQEDLGKMSTEKTVAQSKVNEKRTAAAKRKAVDSESGESDWGGGESLPRKRQKRPAANRRMVFDGRNSESDGVENTKSTKAGNVKNSRALDKEESSGSDSDFVKPLKSQKSNTKSDSGGSDSECESPVKSSNKPKNMWLDSDGTDSEKSSVKPSSSKQQQQQRKTPSSGRKVQKPVVEISKPNSQTKSKSQTKSSLIQHSDDSGSDTENEVLAKRLSRQKTTPGKKQKEDSAQEKPEDRKTAKEVDNSENSGSGLDESKSVRETNRASKLSTSSIKSKSSKPASKPIPGRKNRAKQTARVDLSDGSNSDASISEANKETSTKTNDTIQDSDDGGSDTENKSLPRRPSRQKTTPVKKHSDASEQKMPPSKEKAVKRGKFGDDCDDDDLQVDVTVGGLPASTAEEQQTKPGISNGEENLDTVKSNLHRCNIRPCSVCVSDIKKSDSILYLDETTFLLKTCYSPVETVCTNRTSSSGKPVLEDNIDSVVSGEENRVGKSPLKSAAVLGKQNSLQSTGSIEVWSLDESSDNNNISSSAALRRQDQKPSPNVKDRRQYSISVKPITPNKKKLPKSAGSSDSELTEGEIPQCETNFASVKPLSHNSINLSDTKKSSSHSQERELIDPFIGISIFGKSDEKHFSDTEESDCELQSILAQINAKHLSPKKVEESGSVPPLPNSKSKPKPKPSERTASDQSGSDADEELASRKKNDRGVKTKKKIRGKDSSDDKDSYSDSSDDAPTVGKKSDDLRKKRAIPGDAPSTKNGQSIGKAASRKRVVKKGDQKKKPAVDDSDVEDDFRKLSSENESDKSDPEKGDSGGNYRGRLMRARRPPPKQVARASPRQGGKSVKADSASDADTSDLSEAEFQSVKRKGSSVKKNKKKRASSEESWSDEETVKSVKIAALRKRSAAVKQKQKKPSSSEDSESDEDSVESGPKSAGKGRSSNTKKKNQKSSSDSDFEDSWKPKKGPARRGISSSVKKKKKASSSSEESEDSDEERVKSTPLSTRKGRSSSAAKKKKASSSEESEESDEESVKSTPLSTRKGRSSNVKKNKKASSSEDSGEESVKSTPLSTRKGRSSAVKKKKKASSSEDSGDSDVSEEEIVKSTPLSTRKGRSSSVKKNKKASSSEDSDEESVKSTPLSARKGRSSAVKKKKKASSSEESEESEEESVKSTPLSTRKSRSSNVKKKKKASSSEESEDSEEEGVKSTPLSTRKGRSSNVRKNKKASSSEDSGEESVKSTPLSARKGRSSSVKKKKTASSSEESEDSDEESVKSKPLSTRKGRTSSVKNTKKAAQASDDSDEESVQSEKSSGKSRSPQKPSQDSDDSDEESVKSEKTSVTKSPSQRATGENPAPPDSDVDTSSLSESELASIKPKRKKDSGKKNTKIAAKASDDSDEEIVKSKKNSAEKSRTPKGGKPAPPDSDVDTSSLSESELASIKGKGDSGKKGGKPVHPDSDADTSSLSESELQPVKGKGNSLKKNKKETKQVPDDSDEEFVKSKKKPARKGRSSGGKNKSRKEVTGAKYTRELRQLIEVAKAAGIVYSFSFRNCHTDSERAKSLRQELEKRGMEGEPTVKKGKKLRLMKEAAELDATNILPSPKEKVGRRPCRKEVVIQVSPVKFTGLSDIIDSERSSSE